MKRSRFRTGLAAFAAGAMMLCASAPARAGIPVIDVAAIAQAVQDVLNGIAQIENQYQQIVGLQQQISSISNARSLGDVLNNPALQNYVPREASTLVRGLESGGYRTLAGASKTLRDAQMTYNCMDVVDASQRTLCQSSLAKPYQQKAFMEDALSKARDRVAQINSLMRRAGETTDQKEIQEVTARIGAENALLQHEVSQIELMRGLAEADQRVAESRAREGQLEQASRNRRLVDFVQD
jgi:type IV secretion system protein VirB5